MLGFTPLSEAPLGEGVPIIRVFGYLDSATASLVFTNILFEAAANITASDLVINTNTENTSYVAESNTTLPPTTAALDINTLLYSGLANVTPNTLLLNTAVAIEFDAKAVHTISSASIISYIENVVSQAQADVVPVAIELNLSVDPLYYAANASILPSSLLLNIRNKNLQYTLNNFVYLNTAYSADRILYLNALETRNNTVYVDDKYVTVIYILSSGIENPVVHILPNDTAVIKLNSLLDSDKTLYV